MTQATSRFGAIICNKRVQAFFWNAGAMLVAYALELLVQGLTVWDPENWLTVASGLVIAQISKALRNYVTTQGWPTLLKP